MTILPESQVRQQKLKGVRLTTPDLQLLQNGRTVGNMLRLLWRLKSQLFTILGIMLIFLPFLLLGPAELRDMQVKMKTHFKPLLDLMPRDGKARQTGSSGNKFSNAAAARGRSGA
jgi:hypothetical protein